MFEEEPITDSKLPDNKAKSHSINDLPVSQINAQQHQCHHFAASDMHTVNDLSDELLVYILSFVDSHTKFLSVKR